jgi:hypothetical protein
MPMGQTTAATLAWPHFRGFVAYEEDVDHASWDSVADRIPAIEMALQKVTT